MPSDTPNLQALEVVVKEIVLILSQGYLPLGKRCCMLLESGCDSRRIEYFQMAKGKQFDSSGRRSHPA